MVAKELVSALIPAVKATDSLTQVLSWMDLYRVAHLPVVDQQELIGLISDSDILALTDPDQPVQAALDNCLKIYVLEDQHVYEVIEIISRFKLTLLPVLNREKEYLGSITLAELAGQISLVTAAGQPGAIIVLIVAVRDYSLTGISRIVEENNAKIMSLYVAPDPGTGDLAVTMKLNTSEISSIIRSFERFGFTVGNSFLDDQQLEDLYRTRFEEFMRYINI